MKVIRKFFCQFDMFEAPASFRIRQQPQMKTFTIGLLSFALACFFLYVFVDSSVKMFNYQKISYSDSRTTIKSQQSNGTFSKFAISLDFINTDYFLSMFKFRTYVFKKGQFQRQIAMRPCVASDWSVLGSSYEQDFKNYYLSSMFCPNSQEQFFLNDTFRSDTPDYLKIVLVACTISDNPNCNSTEASQFIEDQSAQWTSVQLWIYVLDKAILPDNQKPVSYFINIDTKAQITTKFGGAAVIQFSTFKIKTDSTVLPWQDIVTESGCMIDTVRNYQIDYNDVQTDLLAVVKFTMNQKQYVINRVVGKIDGLLSYAGGLFSIIIGFLALFLKSFNEYKYELAVGEGAFLYRKDGYQVKQQSLNFWVYIKYTIFDWVHVLCCCKINWNDCIQIDETRQEVIKCLQTDNFFRRLNKLQNISKCHTSLEECVCMNIVALPHIEEIKHEHLLSEYFNQITKNRSQMTLSQIKINNDGTINKINSEYGKEDSYQNFDVSAFKSNAVINLNMRSNLFEEKSMLTDRIQLVRPYVQQNTELKNFAQNIILSPQFQQVEKYIGQSFFRLDAKVRQALQQRVPLLILYRLIYLKQNNKMD